MKNLTICIILCYLFLTVSLFAQDEEIAWDYGESRDVKVTPDEDIVWTFEEHKEEKTIGIFTEKGLIRVPDRKLELSLLSFNLGLSNDYKTIFDIFQEKIEINIDELSGGFNVNVNLTLNPVLFNYNINDICGFGLSTGLDLIGDIGLSGSMLTFNEDDDAKSNINAALFADVKIHGFYTYEKFKIKVKPALYYPLLYAKSDKFTYTYTNTNNDGVDETVLNMGLDMWIYTAFPIEDDFDISDISNISNITAKPGVDISIGADYPLSETLGLNKKFVFLDFDVGIDFINIPIYPAKMEDYMRMIMNIGSDKPINFFNGMFGEGSEEDDADNFFKYTIEGHGKEERNVFRPFKTLFSANWRPFYRASPEDTDELTKRKKEWLTFSPILGFSINPLYSKPFSFEGGIKVRLSLANLFIITLDTGYYDRLWKNSLGLGFNFRIFEIDLGGSMQSQGFLKSWTGGGFGCSFALKLGW